MSLGPALMWKMGGDVSGFNKAVGSAEKRTGKFKSMLGSVMGAFSVGLAVAGLKRLTEELDATAKTARKLGIAPELLQEMRFAAERTGVPVNALDMGMQRFTRRLAEAQQGSGELIGVLEQYNITLRNADGTTRSNVEVLNQLADVIQKTESPAERLRIAFKAFDSEGAAMVNTLANGAAGLDELRKQARDTGQVIGGDTLAQFEKLNDQIDTLSGTLKGAAGKAVGAFLTFGERIGQGAAMAVNALQGIETSFGDDIPSAVENSIEALGGMEEKLENITRYTETLAKIEESQLKHRLKSMDAQEKFNVLRQREVDLYMEIAKLDRGSKEHTEGLLKLNALDIQMQEILAELNKEQTGEQESQLALLLAQLNGNQEQVTALKAQLAEEKGIKEIIDQTGVDRNRATMLYRRQLAAALDIQRSINNEVEEEVKKRRIIFRMRRGEQADIQEYTTEQLHSVLANLSGERRGDLERRTTVPGVIGTYGTSHHLDPRIAEIEAELDARRRFSTLSAAGMASGRYDAFEFERLSRAVGGSTDAQLQTDLLADIRDGIDDINTRTPRY